MSSIVIFLIGSMLSGLSQNIDQLIGFRAIQGLGAGGLMVGAFAIIGDLVPPRERGRFQAIIGGMMPVAFIGGPLLGGFLTDHLSWRWAFYVNVPLGAIALLVTGLGMHLHTPHIKARIDYLGALLLTAGIVSLTLVAAWGGTEYPWVSAQIITLAVVSVVALLGFVCAEGRVPEPILPLRLFRNRNFTIAQILAFLVGAAMFGAVNFLPQYMQDVRGASATTSGLLLLPLMFGMLVVMLAVGQLIMRNGRYRIYPIVGGVFLTAGMLIMLMLKVNTSTFEASALTLVAGLGMGFIMQNTTLITQNSVTLRDMGAASGSVTLFRTIGGSLGVALLGSIFTSRLEHTLTGRLGPKAGHAMASGGTHATPAVLRTLPAAGAGRVQDRHHERPARHDDRRRDPGVPRLRGRLPRPRGAAPQRTRPGAGGRRGRAGAAGRARRLNPPHRPEPEGFRAMSQVMHIWARRLVHRGMKEILVTGGTGVLGRHIVRRLDGLARVRVLSRSGGECEGARVVRGDLETGEGVRDAAEGVDTIVHAATIGFDLRRPDRDIGAARRLLSSIEGEPHIVYVSIVGVDLIPYGYYRTKLAVEEMIDRFRYALDDPARDAVPRARPVVPVPSREASGGGRPPRRTCPARRRGGGRRPAGRTRARRPRVPRARHGRPEGGTRG